MLNAHDIVSAQIQQDTGLKIDIRASTRPGFCEIVFAEKPPREYLDEMKLNGFRWSPRQSLWYGPSNNLPGFAEALEMEQAEPRAPLHDYQKAALSLVAQKEKHHVFVELKPRQQGKTHALKLLTLADSIQKTIDDKLRDRDTNTPKRLAQDMHSRGEGHRWQRAQKLLRALAELDTLPNLLANCISKKAAYDLVGEKTDSVQNGYHSYRIGTGKPSRPEDPACVAAWALIGDKTPEEKQADVLRQKLAGLQFSNIPGYFPTPEPVIRQMISHAQLETGMRVLEPSLGHGALADAVRAEGCEVEGYEVNYALAEICEAKGHHCTRDDFLTVYPEPEHRYDRVIMNPPFEKQADIDHVMHAFKFLKDGGRLVAVMGASTGYRENAKAQAFRAWLTNRDGQIQSLPQDSFKASGTGVGTVLVIVDKGATWVRQPD